MKDEQAANKLLSSLVAQAVLDATPSNRVTYLGEKVDGIVVRYEGVTGTHASNMFGVSLPTNVSYFKGRKSVSVVPIKPDWRPK